jgi:FkbM family methyltransferase
MARQSLARRVHALLDRPGLRPAMAPLGSAFMSRARGQQCRVRRADDHWVHTYADGVVPFATIGGPSPAQMDADTRDLWFWTYVPQAGDTIIDVGAGVGEECLTFSRLAGPSGRVLAFEAHPDTLRWLGRMIQLNGLDNVTALNLAVADEPGELRISSHDPTSLGNTVVNQAEEEDGIRVRADTLDNILDEQGVEVVDFLKMNIEGAETLALEGAARTLSRTRSICVSCHDFVADQGGPDQMRTRTTVVEQLRAAGFDVSLRDDPRPYVRDYVYGSRDGVRGPA